MQHMIEPEDLERRCSRCGLHVLDREMDEQCPAVSDGEMYKRHPKLPPLTDDEIQMFDRALIASTELLYELKV